MMNLYVLTRSDSADLYEFERAVVAAENEGAARNTHPGGLKWRPEDGGWVDSELVEVQLLGVAADGVEAGVIMATSRGAL